MPSKIKLLSILLLYMIIAGYQNVCLSQDISPQIITTLNDSTPVEFYSLTAYPLHFRAVTEAPDSILVDSVKLTIGNQQFHPEQNGDLFTTWWQPDSFGTYTIAIEAYGSNGSQTQWVKEIEVSRVSGSQTVNAFDHDVIQFQGTNSRWLYKTEYLPQFIGCYRQIDATFWTECPNVSGACDDWDRLAWIEVKAPNGEWVELIRYITPYGVGCNHQIDLTDYASVLQGKVEMRMFIDTWGTGGWDVNLVLDYGLGLPQYPYSSVEVLWKGALSFGNLANLQPADTLDISLGTNTNLAEVQFFTTGHGWGENNSQNAAEFYPAINQFRLDDSLIYAQNLITDCNPNPDGCQPQAGTWQYSRAGWCPGMIAPRYEVDLTGYLNRESVELSYILDPRYTDFCHPNNPNCVTGVTCNDCNAGYNPFFQVSANLIRHWETAVPDTGEAITQIALAENFELMVVPNPGKGIFYLRVKGETGFSSRLLVQVVNTAGQAIARYEELSLTELEGRRFDLGEVPAGLYHVLVSGDRGTQRYPLVVQ